MSPAAWSRGRPAAVATAADHSTRSGSRKRQIFCRSLPSVWCCQGWAFAIVMLLGCGAVAKADERSLEEYLSSWQLAAAAREEVFEVTQWASPTEPPLPTLRLLVRLLDRLQGAPRDWQQAWQDDAVPFPQADLAECLSGSRPVRLSGRAVEIRPLPLPGELAVIAGRDALSLVRLEQADGLDVWLVVSEPPTDWPVAGRFDERAASEALLVSLPGAVGQGGPPLLAVSLRLSWWPDTPLAAAGMDYGLFTGVVDGRPLAASEAEAFYHCLAAGRILAATAEMQPLPPAELAPLLNPTADWFASHRGEALVLEGTARRITRIPVASDRWRTLIGQDHYWEIFLFVSTPLIEIGGKKQESYPIVCCSLDLPPELPTGDRVTERLRLAGFAFKRYRYETRQPLGPVAATAAVRESPLLLGGCPLWLPAARPPQLPGWMQWLPAILAAAVGGLLLRLFLRRGRRPPAESLPDRIELPLTEAAARAAGANQDPEIGQHPSGFSEPDRFPPAPVSTWPRN